MPNLNPASYGKPKPLWVSGALGHRFEDGDALHMLTGAKNGAGTAADAKAMPVVAGMVAGADSIDDLDVLRHGRLTRLFGGIRAPSTLGSFPRAFTWEHVRQLQSATRMFTCK